MMKETINQQISALMDGELGDNEQQTAIDMLIDDKLAQKAWAEYHLIRHALQQSAQEKGSLSHRHKIQPFLHIPAANHSRWLATAAAVVVVFILWGIWHGAGNKSTANMPSLQAENVIVNVEHNSDNMLTAQNLTEIAPAMLQDSSTYYQQSYRYSVDMDGLKQVSYSFE